MSLFDGEWCYVPIEDAARAAPNADYSFADGVVRDSRTLEQLATYVAGETHAVVTFPPTENEYGQTVRKRMILVPSSRRADRLTVEEEYRFNFGSTYDNEPEPMAEGEDQIEPNGFSEFGILVRPAG
ncbi:MAG: hypothetical protein EON59_00205 [Alphaproteobacteria bacterium]|nr:MAG: hypothetical protein EON59_00205 [Alphaproteobacteria bacterium]